MGCGEIANVDVVANAGAVGRRIVAPVHRDLVALADRRLNRDLDQVG